MNEKSKSILKKVLLGTKRNNTGENKLDIVKVERPNAKTARLIKGACYDCHSNSTRYPWYSAIQPFKFFIQGHIKGGKEHADFGNWGELSIKKRNHIVEESIEVLTSKYMPPKGYSRFHSEAQITDEQRQYLIDWFKTLAK